VGAGLIPGAALALAVAAGAFAQPVAGPHFRADGPEAERLGRAEGYPHCSGLTYLREQRCRVGALSRFDELFPARMVQAPPVASPLQRAATEPVIRYRHGGRERTLQQYLDTRPVSGFLVAQGDTILLERYQYARTDRHRLTSFSMAKTLTGLLVGIAHADGAIRSLDDPAAAYVPELAGSAYGASSIRHLLQMASGIAFRETYTDTSSDIYQLARSTLEQGAGGAPAVLRRFERRRVPAGERFSYSSAESTVLGLVVAGATGKNMADYATEKLWQPLGAEADASWNVDANGAAIGYAYFNAVLRDWARLGLMLAHDGQWQGRQVVPREYLLEATTIRPGSPFWSTSFAPGAHISGYGYQVWLPPTERRSFQLRGLRGQFVYVDPGSRLVMVQTAVRHGDDGEADQELLEIWRAVMEQFRR
jgi:CubicO group peptidase (beta-lactamase class C family)